MSPTPSAHRARRWRHWAAAPLIALVLAGCSPTAPEASTTEPAPAPGQPDRATLDPGSYPTQPRLLGAAGTNGAVVEGQRMAEYVVGPWEVDPALQTISLSGTVVYPSAESLLGSFTAPALPIATRHQFLVGFSSERSAPAPAGTALQIAVLRFADPTQAAAAATELSGELRPAVGASDPHPLPIAQHPDTLGRTFTFSDDTAAVESFTPHASFVLYIYARARGRNVDAATELTTKALERQVPRIDEFTPTDPAKFAELPTDPTGVLGRTLPPQAGQVEVNHGYFQARAALHYRNDPIDSAQQFTAAAVRGVANGMATVYDTKDNEGAQRLLGGFSAQAGASGAARRPVAAVPGLPAADCFANINPPPGIAPFQCRFAVEHYVASVGSGQDGDVQQRAAAQYLMLTAR